MAPEPGNQHKFRWSWTQIKKLLVGTYHEWSNVEAPRMGASLAYYTVLSLAPLLLVVIAVASFAFGHEAAQGALVGQVQNLVGSEGAQAIQSIIQHAAEKKTTGTFASIAGFLLLLFGASSVAIELRSAMNKIWAAKEEEGVSGFIKQRSYAIAIVLGAGFLLLVSLVVSAGLAGIGKFVGGVLPFPAWVAEVANVLISIIVITGIFAVLFKFLPSASIRWHDVWVGAIFTAVLFTLGKTLIGIYLGKASIGSSYGAAGSLILILVWIYYSAQIFFMGAEFTRIYAGEHGSHREAEKTEDQKSPAALADSVPRVTAVAAPQHSLHHNVAVLAGSVAGLGKAVADLFSAPKQAQK
ncbi:MAG: YihY/virulence factor BrkB family protein [Acidobacteriota bacterium]|nr:YihY/virulence factor BrkB family protein [Acidobacteriota bacterium]